ncbi:MAG: DUF1501 domain-containing protein [Opitutus sp.]|nr:DUF1501 domain-containing protein [Opitutus sp.]
MGLLPEVTLLPASGPAGDSVPAITFHASRTFVVCSGEFGRSPDNGIVGGTAFGRDHNPNAMTIWRAGSGVKAGLRLGVR